MFGTKIISALKNRELVFLFWIIVSIQRSSGLTTCGWIYRNGLLEPKLSQFKATFNLTAIPVVNQSKAWCIPVKNHSLTVDLGSVTNVTRLAVEGENGTENYVTSYEVDYSLDGITFVNIKNGLKPQCSAKEFFGAFPGLSTGSDIAENNVTIPFLAQYVRFRPQESVGKLCTRVDIYGCQSDDGFSPWTQFGPCTSTPQTQTQCSRSRQRTCVRKNEGCRGVRNQTEACLRSQCPRECGELGIIDENRSVNDSAFLASSSKPGFEPHKARLNGPSAWCALTNDQNQFLEIDLGGETEVQELKTQGLQIGNRSAWVSEFFLDFRRSDNSQWQDYMENDSVRIYAGNTNGSMMKRYILDDTPSARFIRFYPLEWTNEICMRVSVSGCRVTPFLSPVTGETEEEVDEAFWILLWVLLGLLLLLLLLGLLYLCCRYCPCCACCACFPCARKRKSRTDEAMMTELTSDEIDAGRAHYAAGITQTDSGPRPPETETQTVAIHLGSEDGRGAGTGAGAVYFSRRDGNVEDTDIHTARYNEGFKIGEQYERTMTSGLSTSHRAAMMGTTRARSEIDGARVAGTGIPREKMMVREDERMKSSQYQRETKSYQDSLRAEASAEKYIGRYEVETFYPGQARLKPSPPLAPPPTIELEVSPHYEDRSWRVERIEQVDDRMAFGGAADGGRSRESELRYQGVGYRGVDEKTRSRAVAGSRSRESELEYRSGDYRGADEKTRSRAVAGSRSRESELEYRSGDYRGADDSERTIKIHLGDVVPGRLEVSERERQDARERYYNQDTYRAKSRADVETWKVNCIRGQSFEGTVNIDNERAGQITGQPFHYHAPQSPTTSDFSSISQFNGSSVSEQFGDRTSRKGNFYKMFEYSRD